MFGFIVIVLVLVIEKPRCPILWAIFMEDENGDEDDTKSDDPMGSQRITSIKGVLISDKEI